MKVPLVVHAFGPSIAVAGWHVGQGSRRSAFQKTPQRHPLTSYLVHKRLRLGQIAHTRVLLRGYSPGIVFAFCLDRRHLKVTSSDRNLSVTP